MPKTKDKRGGKRANAGAKPTGGVKKRPLSTSVDVQVYDRLASEAEHRGVSLSALCAERLSTFVGDIEEGSVEDDEARIKFEDELQRKTPLHKQKDYR